MRHAPLLDPPKIERGYLLITHIPHYLHPDGSVWVDRLWCRDLSKHLTYLRHFTLASPRASWRGGEGLERLGIPADVVFRAAVLPQLDSLVRTTIRLPRMAVALWRAIGAAEIVHSGLDGGWPVPLGWIANSIALIRSRKLIIVVESAPWRLTGRPNPRWRDRLRAITTESLGRFFANRAHLLFFTQPSYRRTLLTNTKGVAYVTPATWVNEQDVLGAAEARESWDRKGELARGGVRFLFAGRLTAEKGVDTLLDAVRILDRRGERWRLDIIGEGPRRDACRALAEQLGSVRMCVLSEVPYGAKFFDLLGQYHAVVVPSLSDEQPRIVFDAFSQALPVLASSTDGLTPHVKDGETGWLFQSNSAEALARVLSEAAKDVARLRQLGLSALAAARGSTHEEMHRSRWRILVEHFGAA